MSLETVEERRRKRIVEHIIGNFRTAKEAIVFGNTVDAVIRDKTNLEIKFRQFVGSPDTSLAITEDYTGETVLKTHFLEIPDQNTAMFICEELKGALSAHNQVNGADVKVMNEVVREKPQPQRLG